MPGSKVHHSSRSERRSRSCSGSIDASCAASTPIAAAIERGDSDIGRAATIDSRSRAIASGEIPSASPRRANSSGGRRSKRSSSSNAPGTLGSGVPSERSSEATASRWLRRTCTSCGESPNRSSASTAASITSTSPSGSPRPTTSTFHWKNSRSRPRCGRSARKCEGIANHLVGSGSELPFAAAMRASVGVNSGRKA